MSATSIEWATHTDNWMAGCDKVSEACLHCYAIPQSAYLANVPKVARYDGVTDRAGTRWTGEIRVDLARMHALFDALDRATKPRRVFLNSMSDTFHEAVADGALDELGDRLYRLPERHVAMLLTKRARRLAPWSARQAQRHGRWLPRNVYIGTTVENQERAEQRVPALLDVLGGLLFVSVEPLLGSITLECLAHPVDGYPGTINALAGSWWPAVGDVAAEHAGRVDWLRRVEWVIVGGESGAHARPMSPRWARALRDECAATATPFLFKQHGEWGPSESIEATGLAGPGWFEASPDDGGRPCRSFPVPLGARGTDLLPDEVYRVGKHAAGRLLDGVEHNGFPEVPRA